MRIRSKLIILNLVTLGGLLLISVFTISGIGAIRDANETASRRSAYTADLLEIKGSSLATIMLDPTLKETRDVFADSEQNIARHGEAALAAIRRPEMKAELGRLLAAWRQYDQHSQALIGLAATDPKAAGDKVLALYNAEFRPYLADLETFIRARRADTQQSIEEAGRVSARTSRFVIGLLALVFVLNVSAVIHISRSLDLGIKGFRSHLAPLSEGDLTRRFPVSGKDELGEIATGMNAFLARLQEIVRSTRSRADDLAGAATELAAAAEQVRQGAVQQSAASGSASHAVAAFAGSIEQISGNVARAEMATGNAGTLSRDAGQTMQVAVREIRHIERSVGEATAQMQALDQQARDIGQIVDVIKDVSDQTNLLALNAAIEAARAGESGRGFAVVADEVRKLAERTTGSAQEISAMVSSIQKSTALAIDKMEEGAALVKRGVQEIDHAGEAMSGISDNTEQVIGVVGDIAGALQVQRDAGQEMSGSVEQIGSLIAEGQSTARNLAEAAGHLETLAAGLQEEVARFRV